MNFKDEIKKAVGLHGKWKKMLRDAITTGKLELHISLIKADDQCNFGKWLYGQTITQQQKDSDHYRTVRELHAAFHEKATKVAEVAASGNKAYAARMLDANGEFAKASAALTTSMMAWLKEAQ